MLSNRRVETRRDYEHRYNHGEIRRKRSRNAGQEANASHHWRQSQNGSQQCRKNTAVAPSATPSRSKRTFLSRYQPNRRRHHQPKLLLETNPAANSPLSPVNSIYQVQITSPQPPHRETKQSRAQRFRDIGVFSRTNSYSTDNLDGRDDDNETEFEDDSSFSYVTDDEESSPRGHRRQHHNGFQQHLRIMDRKEANKHFYQTTSTKDSQPAQFRSPTAPQPQNFQQRQPWNSSQSPKQKDEPFPFCCALNFHGKKPSLMSLSRKRIPGMPPREEQNLWKEAVRYDMQHQTNNGGYHVEDDPTIDRIEVVPVDRSFNTQGGFTYTEREGVGMLFAPKSLPGTPESLPWWKRSGWANLTEEGDTVDNTTRTTSAYNNNGCGNFCTFGKPPKTLLQQARDDIGAQRRHNSGQTRETESPRAKTSIRREGKSRADQLRMGYHNGTRTTNGDSGQIHQTARSSTNVSAIYNSSDLDESLDERVRRIDQLRELEKRRVSGGLQTFDARESGGSTESEVSLSLNVPHLNHDYNASHFELRAQRYGRPYVVEAVHERRDTKEGSICSEQSLLPSGSDLSAVFKEKYDEHPQIPLRRHRIQPMSARASPEVIELHQMPTEDSTVQQEGRIPSGICCHGGMARTWATNKHAQHGTNQRRGEIAGLAREQEACGRTAAKEPKHVIFVDEQINEHDLGEKNRTQRNHPASFHSLQETTKMVHPSIPHKVEVNRTNFRNRLDRSMCQSTHEQTTPKKNFLAFQRKAPSPIKLYGDPPEMRHEDGSPVASPRSHGTNAQRFSDACTPNVIGDSYRSYKAFSTEDEEVGNLGKDLQQLLNGLSPAGTDRPDGLIIFKPTINVIRSNGKAELELDQKDRGHFVQQSTESVSKTRNGSLSPINVLSAEGEYSRAGAVSSTDNTMPLPPELATKLFNETEPDAVKTCSVTGRSCWKGLAKPWYYPNGQRMNQLQGLAVCTSNRRVRSQLQPEGLIRPMQGFSDVIDLSQQIETRDSPLQDGNLVERNSFPEVVSSEIRIHRKQRTPPESPPHQQSHHGSSPKIENVCSETVMDTDLNFMETEAKPMIPLGLSINDYSSPSKQFVFRTPDTTEEARIPGNQRQNENPPSKLRVDTDLSWKTVHDLYRLEPSGNSGESLEIVFRSPSTDEDDHRRYIVDGEQEDSSQNDRNSDDNQSEAIASFGRNCTLGSGTRSLHFAESISSGSNSSGVFDLDAIIAELEPNQGGTSSKNQLAQTQSPSSNHEKQAKIFGQKIYAELLRRGKVGLGHSSARKRKTLKPVHEVPEPRGEETMLSKDRAIKHRNAAVSRLRRLRKLQSKLHPHADNGAAAQSPMETAKTAGANMKSTPSTSLKARLDARKKPTRCNPNPVENPQSVTPKPPSNYKPSNSLLEVYVQDPAKTPCAATRSAQWKSDVSSKVGWAAQSSSAKTPKDKLVSSMSRKAQARSVAAAKPGR